MRRTRRKQIPWGRISGVLMGVFVTLSCVIQQVEPYVITQRAALAVLVTGTIVRLSVIFVQHTMSSRRTRTPTAMGPAKHPNQT